MFLFFSRTSRKNSEVCRMQNVLSILSTSQSCPIASLHCVYIVYAFASYTQYLVKSSTLWTLQCWPTSSPNHVYIVTFISHLLRRHCWYRNVGRYRFYIVSTSFLLYLVNILDIAMLIDIENLLKSVLQKKNKIHLRMSVRCYLKSFPWDV